jgi:hypothetical protein
MEATTWIDRITDETNPWLTASKKEEESDFPQAVTLYLKDAEECLKQEKLVKAALSCSCAADCLAKIGQFRDAQLLYSETAHLYLENANFVIGKSVRESLWSLRESHEYFLLAEDKLAAQHVYDRLIHLASRVDPNNGSEAIAQLPTPRASILGRRSIEESIPYGMFTGMTESLEQFLRMRRSHHGLEVKPSPSKLVTTARRSGPINEESIISQLG